MIFSVLDFETTGLGPAASRVLEVGILKITGDGEIIDTYDTLVNPLSPVGATWIHGITDKMVKNAPFFEEVADDILQFLDGSVIAAHNANFDIPFLREELKRADKPYAVIPSICTLRLSRKYIKGCGSYSLSSLCSFLHITNFQAHSALADADAAAQLLLYLIQQHEIGLQLETEQLFSNNYQDRKMRASHKTYSRRDYFN
ncbi:MAG: 3'-5' exonuclease [Spirochaetia bacterium]|nr:3'-5' exonuclease [Spirochaetia bacterium]